MPRTFAPSKKDTTQPIAEQMFRESGWSVCDVHALGKNAPDMFVAKENVTIAVEMKSAGRKRKEHQVAWAESWQGHYLTGDDPAELVERAFDIYFKNR